MAKLHRQNFLCAYSGSPLVVGLNATLDHRLPQSRFPEERANVENTEWVTAEVNRLKGDSTPEEFLTLLGKICEYQNSGTGKGL